MGRSLQGVALMAILAAGSLGGCTFYEPDPLDARALLADLRAIRLDALAARTPAAAIDSSRPVDLRDGLSQEEAVALALVANPGLRAFREERGVAEGQIVEAGLLPNPSLSGQFLFAGSLSKSDYGAALEWSPPRPGELAARTERAKARLAQVLADVAREEWRVATAVRKTYVALLATVEQLRVLDAQVRLHERVVRFMTDKRGLGDATDVEVNLATLTLGVTLQERNRVTYERERFAIELASLLGAGPDVRASLERALEPPPADLVPRAREVLEDVMLERQPALRAIREEYAQAEQTLDLAYIRRWPWITFGPTVEHEGGDVPGAKDRVGLHVGIIDIPIANQNQGAIAVATARRRKVRESLRAAIHEHRTALADALRRIERQEAFMRLYERSLRPALEESARLTESGFEMREFDLTRLVTTQERVLRSRSEFIAAQLEHWSAIYDLEQTVGARLATLRGP